jgi:hypothetical protein
LVAASSRTIRLNQNTRTVRLALGRARALRVKGATDPQIFVEVVGGWLGEEAFGHRACLRSAEALEHREGTVEVDVRRCARKHESRRMIRVS